MSKTKQTYIDFSSRITVLSFILSIGIVYQHTVWNYDKTGIIDTIQKCFFFHIESFVPLFFMISGYLFFRTYNPSIIKSKLLSRVKSLLIPYLIWNTVYTAFIVIMVKLNFIHNAEIPNNAISMILRTLNSTYSPLWFIKYLMIFVVLSPILYKVLKKKCGALLIVFSLALNLLFYCTKLLKTPLNVNANNIYMVNYQLVYYLTGSYAALHWKKAIESNDKPNKLSLLVICFLFMIYIASKQFWDIPLVPFAHFYRLLFAVTIYFISGFLPAIDTKKWMKNSFFIYCSHMIPLQCIQRVLDIMIAKAGINNQIMYIVEYLILPIIIVTLLIIVAELLKKHFQHFASVISGNRG